MIGLPNIWRLRTLAFVALALAGFGAMECPPKNREKLLAILGTPSNILAPSFQFSRKMHLAT